MRSHVYSQKWTASCQRPGVPISLYHRQTLGWPWAWLSMTPPVRLRADLQISREYGSGSEGPNIQIFSFCKSNAFIWPLKNSSTDSLPQCTRLKPNWGWFHSFCSVVCDLSCPLGQYPAWSGIERRHRSSSLLSESFSEEEQENKKEHHQETHKTA